MISLKEYIESRKRYLRSRWWQYKNLWRFFFTRPNTLILYNPLYYRNDYQLLLYKSLPKDCVALCMSLRKWRYLPFFKAKNLYYHQHWFNDDLLRSDKKKAALFEDIQHFKKYQGRVLWTVHNIFSHKAIGEEIQIDFYRRLAEQVDYIHLHYHGAEEIVRPYYTLPAHKIIIAPHGHYLDVIAPYMANQAAPAYEPPIRFFAGGMLRPYKAFDTLCDLFCQTNKIPANARLIIAGRKDKRVTIAHSANIETHIGEDILSEREFFSLVRGSHFTILPYSRSLTSGMLLYALSCGTPVIAPNYGHFQALINPSNGFLYDMQDKDGLAKAIEHACSLTSEAYQAMRQSAYNTAAGYDWQDIIAPLFLPLHQTYE